MIRRLLFNMECRQKTAVIENDKAFRYSDLAGKACALQTRLPQNILGNVAIFLPDGGGFIAALWGIIALGITAFPLNILMTVHEIAPLLKHARVTTVVTETAYRHLFKAPEFEELSLKIIFIDELEPTPPADSFNFADINPNKPMLLLSTSGTTEKCKIVQLSEVNIETCVLGFLEKLQITGEESDFARFIVAVPFSSAYGVMVITACLMRCFPIITAPSPFTLNSFYRAAEKHKATHYEGSTSTVLMMEQTAEKHIPYDISALKNIGFGGSKVSGAAIKKLHDAFPEKYFFQGYGMTEASPLIAKHIKTRVEKTESVGTAITGLKVAVEVDDKIVRSPHTTGEIVVKGANVMLGYYDNETETNKVLKNGYLYTGDIGFLDEDGYLYICGRKKNIIIVRGFNVYPEEVEQCLYDSALVKDCVVYGRLDNLKNEIVCADIVPMHPRVKEEAIKHYCSVHLADYKQPNKIIFRKSIKKNITGKTQRRKGQFA